MVEYVPATEDEMQVTFLWCGFERQEKDQVA